MRGCRGLYFCAASDVSLVTSDVPSNTPDNDAANRFASAQKERIHDLACKVRRARADNAAYMRLLKAMYVPLLSISLTAIDKSASSLLPSKFAAIAAKKNESTSALNGRFRVIFTAAADAKQRV